MQKREEVSPSELWIEMLPAEEGDCLLVTMPDVDIRVLIDGGTAETYHKVLRNKLIELSSEKKVIDLLIVTHIDSDHIGGIIELLKENETNGNPQIIPIKNIWHNSYRHLQIDKVRNVGVAEKQILENMVSSLSNDESYILKNNIKGISALQGTTLAAWILKGGYSWNKQFKELAVSNLVPEIRLSEDCTIKVLLPRKQDLDNLAKKWKYELKKKRFSFRFAEDEIFDDAYEYYFRYLLKKISGVNKEIATKQQDVFTDLIKNVEIKEKEDYSETNLASISLIIEYRGKKILLLADNVADHIADPLNDEEYYNAIKVPHHGSKRNISNGFLEKFYADNYLISTNSSKFNHPDMETLVKIFNCRQKRAKQIIFNYEIQKGKEFSEMICTNQDIEVTYLKKGQKIIL